MKILFVSSEVTPLVKVGGLGDVVGSLPRSLTAMGHEARVITPQYNCIDISQYAMTPVMKDFKFSMLGDTHLIDLNLINHNGVGIYTLDNQKYFGGREVYEGGYDLERFFFFSRAVCELIRHLDWQPDIVHCHDWLTALLVMWLKKAGYPYRLIYTIHNLAYQGAFDQEFLLRHDLKKDWDYYPPDAPRLPLNFMSQAILWADLVTTVSQTYAGEITTPEYGVGLDALLRYRKDSLLGIVNGIDYDEWNPWTDPYIPVNYNSNSLTKRINNKLALQKVAGLPVSSDIPLIGMIQRLDPQKGFDILEKAIEPIVRETQAQFVILGKGWENYENMLRDLSRIFPRNVSAFIAFENPLAHLIYSGCDIFLMPSRFEPCGLGQMIAMRYGALPVVRHTGGLVDTVPGFNSGLTEGNGFVFHEYSSEALIAGVEEAVTAFKNRSIWQVAMQRVSSLDFSWRSSAGKYVSAYRLLLEKREPE